MAYPLPSSGTEVRMEPQWKQFNFFLRLNLYGVYFYEVVFLCFSLFYNFKWLSCSIISSGEAKMIRAIAGQFWLSAPLNDNWLVQE